ncbi:hypothetical protein BDK92_0248 [Micromonospora pisi]|uniref:Uncharacterized protein n=1 Tax=Micromonospora pisi TaxID=589240 RepID=A0A495JD88_9ACTN|nr:hypothetical protein [Micromonospora pisi]RKR86029.1 hypothetical protein BDK92_0248 [Micromonospora pisi]
MSREQPGDGARHDEPNDYGFAGDPTAPQPERANRPDELDEAEQVAVPGDDLTEGLSESLEEERLREWERQHPDPEGKRA